MACVPRFCVRSTCAAEAEGRLLHGMLWEPYFEVTRSGARIIAAAPRPFESRRAEGTFHPWLIVLWEKQTCGRPVGFRYYPEAGAPCRAVTAQYPKAMGEAVIVFGAIVFV